MKRALRQANNLSKPSLATCIILNVSGVSLRPYPILSCYYSNTWKKGMQLIYQGFGSLLVF